MKTNIIYNIDELHKFQIDKNTLTFNRLSKNIEDIVKYNRIKDFIQYINNVDKQTLVKIYNLSNRFKYL